MNPIQVLIVDDSSTVRSSIKAAISECEDIATAGVAKTGAEALAFLENNRVDIMVLDLIMPELDGFGVLKYIKAHPSVYHPRVIIHSLLCRDDFISAALALGAAYYVVKGQTPAGLISAIRSVAAANRPSPLSVFNTREEQLRRLLFRLGIGAHLFGHIYLREAVLMVMDDPDRIAHMHRSIYNVIAEKHSSCASNIERSMRHAIEICWKNCDTTFLHKTFGFAPLPGDARPSNNEFISLLAERLRRDLYRFA